MIFLLEKSFSDHLFSGFGKLLFLLVFGPLSLQIKVTQCVCNVCNTFHKSKFVVPLSLSYRGPTPPIKKPPEVVVRGQYILWEPPVKRLYRASKRLISSGNYRPAYRFVYSGEVPQQPPMRVAPILFHSSQARAYASTGLPTEEKSHPSSLPAEPMPFA